MDGASFSSADCAGGDGGVDADVVEEGAIVASSAEILESTVMTAWSLDCDSARRVVMASLRVVRCIRMC